MKQKRFLELVSRKMASEATQDELAELFTMLKTDKGLATLYNDLSKKNPSTEADHTRAEQSFALHAIKMQLATGAGEPQGSKFSRRLRKRRFMMEAFAFGFLLLSAGSYYVLQPSLAKREPLVSNVVEVPVEQRKKLVLSDGSVVWLNSKSKLTYPAQFNGKTREVELEGEALFDVAHDAKKPFIVITPQYRVNVLGTVFNVKSYPENSVFETTLISGSVRVQETRSASVIAVLKPNEKFSYDKVALATTVTRVDAPVYSSWTGGVYQFDHVTLGEVLNDLENYKDVTIIIGDSSLLDIRYTGKFRQSESIEQIMDVLKTDIPFTYQYNPESKKLTLLPVK